MEKGVLRIETLGKFSVTCDGNDLSSGNARSTGVWRLFKYLLLHRHKPVATRSIIECLWPDGNCENPLKALYTLIYRLRNILKEGAGRNYFTFSHDCYIWDGDAPIWTDYEAFESLLSQAGAAEDLAERKALYAQADALYGGSFLQEAGAQDRWASLFAAKYRAMYADAIVEYAGLYTVGHDPAKAAKLLEQALEKEPQAERLHEAQINICMLMGDYARARFHYEHALAFFGDTLDQDSRRRLAFLYSRITQQRIAAGEDLAAIQRSLLEEDTEKSGAIFCSMEIFRYIYCLFARLSRRNLAPAAIISFTIQCDCNSSAAEDFKNTLMHSLRISDVITQLSQRQFLLLLSPGSAQYSALVAQRILENYRRHWSEMDVPIEYEIGPVLDL